MEEDHRTVNPHAKGGSRFIHVRKVQTSQCATLIKKQRVKQKWAASVIEWWMVWYTVIREDFDTFFEVVGQGP